MKISLSMELNDKQSLKHETEEENYEPTKAEIKEELTQMFFEVCEDWVLRGQVPELNFEK